MDKFPFAFDADKMKDMFKMPEIGSFFDMTMFTEAQSKNMTALIEANKTTLAGYQALYARQLALFDEAVATAQKQMSGLKGEAPTAESATKAVETMREGFEKAIAEVKEMSEMAQKTHVEAFEIVKARAEEAIAEMRAATEKLAA